MKERRKAQRKQTDEFFGVYYRETDEFFGKLIDLSIMGMKIQSVEEIDVGSIYEFRIDLPTPLAGKTHLTLISECVWCHESTTSKGEYNIGFQITEKQFQKIETIQSLLNEVLFYDSQDQLRITLAKKST